MSAREHPRSVRCDASGPSFNDSTPGGGAQKPGNFDYLLDTTFPEEYDRKRDRFAENEWK